MNWKPLTYTSNEDFIWEELAPAVLRLTYVVLIGLQGIQLLVVHTRVIGHLTFFYSQS